MTKKGGHRFEGEEKSTIRCLAAFAGEKKKLYWVSVILAVAGVACSIIHYVIIGSMAASLIGGNRDWAFYLANGIVLAVLWTARAVLHGLSTSCSHKATFYKLASIRKQLCGKLARVSLGRVKDTPSGTLKNLIVERVDSIETTLAHVVPEFTANLLAPLAVFVYLLILDWRMALVSLITLAIGIVCYMGMLSGYQESFQNTIEKTKVLNDTAVEYINGIEVIKAFGKAQQSYEKFEKAAREGADCFVEWMRRCNVFASLAITLMPCTALAVVPIGGYFYMRGTLAAADLVMCLILSLGLIAPLITAASYTDDLAKIGTIIGEVTGVLSWEEVRRPERAAEEIKDYSITLDHVTFAYHDKEVLHDVNMEIREGTVNALVGPSGSGKTTIARLIASFWDPAGGSIRIGGVDLRSLPFEQYNRNVAYVSQDNYLFNDTIRENIRMGNRNASDKEVEEAAVKCGCHKFIMGLENGYDTIAGSAGGHLSGGERQRISIARAMLGDAPIVILDEATSYTDPENEALMQSSIAKLVRGKTLIVIAHRLSTIVDADRIFVIHNGMVAEEGTHEQLLAERGLYQRMWKANSGDKAQGGAAHA